MKNWIQSTALIALTTFIGPWAGARNLTAEMGQPLTLNMEQRLDLTSNLRVLDERTSAFYQDWFKSGSAKARVIGIKDLTQPGYKGVAYIDEFSRVVCIDESVDLDALKAAEPHLILPDEDDYPEGTELKSSSFSCYSGLNVAQLQVLRRVSQLE